MSASKFRRNGFFEMNVLLANKYFFRKGGADNSFFATAELLKENGHGVRFFSMHHPRNESSEFSKYFVSEVKYDTPNIVEAARAAGRLLYSFEARRRVSDLLRDFPVDIAHLNSIYHQISPSIIDALVEQSVPVVMTLRDYKVVCASYVMLAGGGVCEACEGGRYYNCFLKRCVKGSGLKSALNTLEMYLHHNVLKLYEKVDVFISPSEFLRDKVTQLGFCGHIEVIPNFADLTVFQPNYVVDSSEVVYFGRLSWEKGLLTLVRAAKGLPLTVRLIGEGPYRHELEQTCARERIDNVIFSGYQSGVELRKQVQSALCVVVPSEWYENNPRTVIEGFALGKAAIGARIGGIPELVRDGETGFTFESGSLPELREKLGLAVANRDEMMAMGKRGRRLVEEEFSPERHYEKLVRVYENAARF